MGESFYPTAVGNKEEMKMGRLGVLVSNPFRRNSELDGAWTCYMNLPPTYRDDAAMNGAQLGIPRTKG